MKKLTRCIWLVDLLMRIDNLTRSEIADRWMNSEKGENTYPERTFYRDKKDIPELCGAVIEENGYGGYFISNKEDVLSNKAYQLFASAIKKQELNFCVRNGNRWNLTVIDTGHSHGACHASLLLRMYPQN